MIKKTIQNLRLPVALPLLLAAIVGSLLTGGCDEKELYTHEELYTGSLLLSLGWQEQQPPTADKLDVSLRSLTAGVAADTTFRLPPDGSEARLPLPEARYEVIALHEAANIRFDGECFCLENPENEPGAFSAGIGTAEVSAQQPHSYMLPLFPFTRSLTLRFRLDADTDGRLAGMEAALQGIATSRRLADRSTTRDAATTARPEMKTEETAARSSTAYAGTLRLLGVHTGQRQLLTLTLRYTNGESETLTQDLTPQLAGFNHNGTEGSLTLTARISIAGAAQPQATIVGWEQGTDSELDAGNE